MRLLSHLHLIFAFVQFSRVIDGQGDNCPAKAYPCASPSSLSNLLCYIYKKAQGFNYAVIGFGDGINAFCSINFKCAPAKESQMDVVTVLGFVIEVSYVTTSFSKAKTRPLNLFYVDVSRGPSCPRVFPVRDTPFSADGSRSNPPLYPSPIPAALVYDIIERTKESYQGQCNLFQSVDYNSCDDCCDGKKYCSPPVTSISLKSLKSAIFYSSVNSNDSAVERYLSNYGVCGVACGRAPPEPGSIPPLQSEPCSSYGFNDTTRTCQDYHDTVTLSQILNSYGYVRPTLGPREACEISTYKFQGPANPISKMPTRPTYNPSYTTSFCTIAIIPEAIDIVYSLNDSETKLLVLYALMEGYCENDIKEKIMKHFMDTC